MKRFIIYALIVIAVASTGLFIVSRKASTTTPTSKPPVSASNIEKPISKFDKSALSITDPTSLWVIANKKHPLAPKNYAPADLVFPKVALRVPGNESMQLRQPAASALETMFAAAKGQGLELMLSSGYRSYDYQVSLYNSYVSNQGQSVADTQSARPGYSEHQTGLAADIEPATRVCEVQDCFADTPEGKWLKANAYKYGFLLRYQAKDQALTGYKDEAWHYRFVGEDLTKELQKSNITTLEAFFDVTGGDYK